MKKELDNFFNPKIIAVIGASAKKDKVGSVLMEKLQTFKGRVVPINPNHAYVFGRKAYADVLKCPWKIDLAVIAIPAPFVNAVLEQCGKKAIKNVIIISAGFAEQKNVKLEEQILETANKHKIKILGPNCFGVSNPYLNLDTTFSNTSPKAGDLAFISQSGALFSYVSDFQSNRFSGFVSLGNQAMLSFTDFIKYFDKDPNTNKIILYIEKLKNGKEFIKTCQNSKKEIVVVKAGQTKKGTQATISHTGSLATDFKVYEGAFKQAGVKVVDTLAEAFEMKKENIKLPSKKPVQIITNAGGGAALVADNLTKQGIDVEVKDLLGTAIAKDYEKQMKKTRRKKVIILTPQKMSQPQEVVKLLGKNDIAVFLGEKSMKDAISLLKQKNIKYYTKCC